MQADLLFEVGVQWKHRATELLVSISQVVAPGLFKLSFVLGQDFEADWATKHILMGTWTTDELLLHFSPMPLRLSRYDLIGTDELF